MMVDPFSVTSGGLKPHWNTLMPELAVHLDPRTSRLALSGGPETRDHRSAFVR